MTREEWHKKAAAQTAVDRAATEKANAEAQNWRVRCKSCGKTLKGPLAQIQAHEC